MEDINKTASSRRELFKKSLKAVGYSVPAMMVFSTVSLDAFASSYGKGRPGCGSTPHGRHINIIKKYLMQHPELYEYLKKRFPYFF